MLSMRKDKYSSIRFTILTLHKLTETRRRLQSVLQLDTSLTRKLPRASSTKYGFARGNSKQTRALCMRNYCIISTLHDRFARTLNCVLIEGLCSLEIALHIIESPICARDTREKKLSRRLMVCARVLCKKVGYRWLIYKPSV